MALADHLESLLRKAGEWQHSRVARSVLETAPIAPRDDGVVLFSMIGTRVVLPYLVAIKSLHHHLQRGRIMVLNDGTLDDADRSVLAAHCGNLVIIEPGDIKTAPCPTGNCWERLLSILDLRTDDYVVQLDSDTVTLGPVPEVAAAIDANRSFTLGGGVEDARHAFMAIPDMVRSIYADGPARGHIQSLIEAQLGNIPDAANFRYIRGCAGFAGFSRSCSGRQMAEQFAVDATRVVGARFSEWGSEQAASNFVIANDPDPLQLPYERYTNHWEEALPPDPAFIHYIGTYRYARGSYVASTEQAIRMLKQHKSSS